MKINLSPAIRLSLGLVFLTTTILFIAEVLGLIPDVYNAQFSARKNYTEALAIQLAKSAEKGHIHHIKEVLTQISDRNTDILSTAVKLNNGAPLIVIGDHERYWNLKPGQTSTPTQMLVPIYSHNKPWGKFEISFKPLDSGTFIAWLNRHGILLAFFVGIIGFLAYWLFLKRSLKALDPSAVVPARVRSAMDSLSEGVLILDDKGSIVLANRAFGERVGIEPEKLLGKEPNRFRWEVSRDTKNKTLPWQRSLQDKEIVTDVSVTLHTTNNKPYSFMVSTSPIANEGNILRGVLVTFNDVTQLAQKNNQLQKVIHTLKKSQVEVRQKNRALQLLASLDPLTGCMNRRSFFEAATKAYTEARQISQSTCCLMVDIDHFKSVNDNYGHSVGDQVIRSVAETIKSSLREGDWLCRYGGEEFCIYLQKTNKSQAGLLAERIRTKISELDFSNNPSSADLHVTASLGLAESNIGISSLNLLIELADQALYAAKENGRNRVVTWTAELNNAAEQTASDMQKNGGIKQSAAKDNKQAGIFSQGRKSFYSRIQSAIKHADTNDSRFCVAIFDIDFFRRINNSLGHQAGDQIIQTIEQRLQNIFSKSGISPKYSLINAHESAFHLAGDDFGLLIQTTKNTINPVDILTDIVSQLSEAFLFNDQKINITYSMGASSYPLDGHSADLLLQHAEIAMYHAKEKGGNLIETFKEEINSSSLEKLQLETALYNAIENNELSIVYQPKIDLKTQSITGLEALLRWNHSTLGHIPPDTFIPIAEKNGYISELGFWTLRAACAQTKKWREQQNFDASIAVNLSALQLKQPTFVEKTLRILNDTGLPPQQLELEVTENVLMENLEVVTTALYRLSDQSVKIAIDDFGTGYSSLSYLKRFPINTLKIDRCFVQDITNDQDDEAIVKAIIAMSKALNLTVVAEGVETEAQLDKLRDLHCEQLQGYLVSQPLRAEQITKLLQSSSLIAVDGSWTESNKPQRRQVSVG